MLDQAVSKCSAPPASFRFLGLPRELRDEVYKYLLCNFKPAPNLNVDDIAEDEPCGYYVQTVHPSILRVNKQLHREAYVIMVKTNRFIHCILYGGSLTSHMFGITTRRIICHDEETIEAFNGCAMTVSVTPKGIAWFRPGEPHLISRVEMIATHRMILGEDCERLVKTLANLHMPNLGKTLDITLAMIPYLEGMLHTTRESLERFFGEVGTQEQLLAPFQEKLRGVQKLMILGVDPTLAKTVKEDIAKDEWTDPKAVLAEIRTAKQSGNDAFKSKEYRLASGTWEEAVNEIDRIHNSSSWRNLVAKSDMTFIDAVAELFYLMCLNIMRAQLIRIDQPISGDPFSHDAPPHSHLMLAAKQIVRIMNARSPGWWKDDYEWEPTEAQLAKFLFRQAMYMRAEGVLNCDPDRITDATMQLIEALRILPDDPVIKRELENMEQTYEYMLSTMEEEDAADREEMEALEDERQREYEYILAGGMDDPDYFPAMLDPPI